MPGSLGSGPGLCTAWGWGPSYHLRAHPEKGSSMTGRMRSEKRATDITKQCWGCRKSHYRREASILGTGKPSVLGIGFRGETASLENVWQGAWSNGHLEYATGMPKYP